MEGLFIELLQEHKNFIIPFLLGIIVSSFIYVIYIFLKSSKRAKEKIEISLEDLPQNREKQIKELRRKIDEIYEQVKNMDQELKEGLKTLEESNIILARIKKSEINKFYLAKQEEADQYKDGHKQGKKSNTNDNNIFFEGEL